MFVIFDVTENVSYCKYCLLELDNASLDAHFECFALVQKFREENPDRQSLEELAELLGVTFDRLPFLTEIDLSGSDLLTLPSNLEIFTKVRILELSNNLLRELPESIGKLKELRELRLDHNFLEYLPNSITNLTNLTKLTLRSNQLKELPELIGN